MNIVVKNISELKPAGYNPRAMTEAEREALKKSFEQFGFAEPIIINVHPKRKNVIIGGHQRVLVAKEIGLEDVPCVELNLTLAKERELNVRLNKNVGHWDPEALSKYFDVNDLIGWGFTKKDLDFDVAALVDKKGSKKSVRENVTTVFQLGELRFEVTAKQYTKWMDSIVEEGAMTDKEKIACVKERLKLR